MAEFNVTISKRSGTYWVSWGTSSGLTLGLVPTATPEIAEKLKANLENGMPQARAVRDAIVPRSRKTGTQWTKKWANQGAAARAAALTPERRREIAIKAGKARGQQISAEAKKKAEEDPQG